jgi:hypothetical protein
MLCGVLCQQCAQHFDQCAFVEILERSGHQKQTVRLKKKHSKVHSGGSPSSHYANITKTFDNGYDFYRHSTFCLHPPGDMEMRKGMFDSMLLGCIPVLFLPHILERKYPWYFTHQTEADVSVNVKLSTISNIVTHLAAIPPEVIEQKQHALADLAASLSYSLPPYSAIPTTPAAVTAATVVRRSWSPPFRDATDVMLAALFRRVRAYRANRLIPPQERVVWKSDFELYWQ